MAKKHGLGIGLNALLSDIKRIDAEDVTLIKSALKNLPLDVLRPGKYQPRREMDHESLEELASSIRAQGIIQPLVVRSVGPNAYEIIAGERRWRAAQLANLQEVPAVIREITDDTAIAFSLIENIQRENLNVMDTAVAVQRLIDEFAMSHASAAEAIGKSRVSVTNLLRLLSLQHDVKTMVQRGELEMGHARALLALETMQQLAAARQIVEKGLSVRATENLVRHLQRPRNTTFTPHDVNVLKLQQSLADKLGARVIIQHAKSGKGKVVVKYNSLEELEGILTHIK